MKKVAYLIRDKVYDSCTLGQLFIDDEIFYTLERPWLNNQSNISCIPQGEYQVTALPRSSSGKYRDVFHIQDVPDRFGVLIHNGNIVKHTKGCILIGNTRGYLGNEHAVLSSKPALQRFNRVTNKQDFTLIILGGY